MSSNLKLCFLTLPVEIVYHILDHLEVIQILFSMRNVSKRVNAIVDTYHRYQTLNELDLSSETINSNGIKYLASALQYNTTLTSLIINYQQICSPDVQYLAKALYNETSLTKLNLYNNQIGNQGAQYLAIALQHNKVNSSI
ncbi:unnamed protein product [Adineta steineri]|uniref:F-box domain-containing protein n=1 Tax=Adineta steineri TaxID=433720 RepID=A0A813Y4P1_9BILA|nr:unnamed protein product [Adineta steineri]CAF0914010.1 unnamed protein product [Adineta steineri]